MTPRPLCTSSAAAGVFSCFLHDLWPGGTGRLDLAFIGRCDSFCPGCCFTRSHRPGAVLRARGASVHNRAMAFSSRTSETSDSGSDASGWTEREPDAEYHDKRRGATAHLQRINAHDLHLRHTAQMRAEYIDELVQRRKKAAVPPSQNSIILAKLQDTRQYIDELVDENEAFASMVDTLRAVSQAVPSNSALLRRCAATVSW